MDISERIRFLRTKKLNITQENFGDSIGLSRANIANIECGRIATTDRVVKDICEKYNVNEEWLRNGKGDVFEELSIEEEIAEFVGRILKGKEDSFKKRYIEMLSKLDDDGWEALEKVAKSFINTKKD